MPEITVMNARTECNRGLPPGYLFPSREVVEMLKIHWQTWQKWKADGLETHRPGTDAEYVFTDDLFNFIRSKKKPR